MISPEVQGAEKVDEEGLMFVRLSKLEQSNIVRRLETETKPIFPRALGKRQESKFRH